MEELSSVFAGAILLSSPNTTVTGNTIINNSPFTMRYGININKTDMALRTDGSSTIAISGNTFFGTFVDGRVLASNQQTGQRVNSVASDGALVRYPEQPNFDQSWTTAPPDTPYFAYTGTATRDAVNIQGGSASLQTIAGGSIDISLKGAGLLYNSIVTVSFSAKALSGSSYLSVFTTLAGLNSALTVTVTDTAWRQYSVSFALTPNLEKTILLRLGSNGASNASFQDIQISGRRP